MNPAVAAAATLRGRAGLLSGATARTASGRRICKCLRGEHANRSDHSKCAKYRTKSCGHETSFTFHR